MEAIRYRLEVLLPDGRSVIAGHDGKQRIEQAPSFDSDGLRTWHGSDFLADAKFREAYRKAAVLGQNYMPAEQFHIEWRAYLAGWAAKQCLGLPGDFVECGVNRGFLALFIYEYTGLDQRGKRFFLFDTYEGIPEAQMSTEEAKFAKSKNARYYQHTDFDHVRRCFAPYRGATLVKGIVPDSLAGQEIDQVAFLSIDMNIAAPEIAAFQWFWPRLSPGGICLLDDYNSPAHRPQKAAFDALAAELGLFILALPTGQGLIIKQ